jgi:hypothetical protein
MNILAKRMVETPAKRAIGMLLCLSLVLLPLLFPSLSAQAEIEEVPADAPNVKLVLSPVSLDLHTDFEVVLQPNTTYENEEYTSFIIANGGKKELTVDLSVQPYYLSSTTYEGNISHDANAYTELAKWISFDQTTYTLKSGERITVPFSIHVPKDAPGGGQYAIIYATAGPSDDASGVAAESQLGLPIYSRVGGETREGATLTSQDIPSFLWSPPIVTHSTINNTGNVDAVAEYHLIVKNIFGRLIYDYTKDGHILPNAPRDMELKWDKTPLFGVYKVQQQIKVKDEIIGNIEKTVFVVPIWLVIIPPILIAGFVVIKLKTRKSKRAYGR